MGRLWSKLTAAVANKDMEAAQAAKSEVEESQRALAREREAKGIVHKQRFFELRNGLWQAKIESVHLSFEANERSNTLSQDARGPRRDGSCRGEVDVGTATQGLGSFVEGIWVQTLLDLRRLLPFCAL